MTFETWRNVRGTWLAEFHTWLKPSTNPPNKWMVVFFLHTFFFEIFSAVKSPNSTTFCGCTGQSQHLSARRETVCAVVLYNETPSTRLPWLLKCGTSAEIPLLPMCWLTIRGKPDLGNNEDLLHLWMTVVKDIALMMDKVAWMWMGWKAPQKSSLDVSWRWQIWLVCTSNSGEPHALLWPSGRATFSYLCSECTILPPSCGTGMVIWNALLLFWWNHWNSVGLCLKCVLGGANAGSSDVAGNLHKVDAWQGAFDPEVRSLLMLGYFDLDEGDARSSYNISITMGFVI